MTAESYMNRPVIGAAGYVGVSCEMPRYRCHKEVHALKIEKVVRMNDESGVLYPMDKRYGDFEVDTAYMQKHDPRAGGYYVVYADGYTSFSPAEAFEDGYTLIV